MGEFIPPPPIPDDEVAPGPSAPTTAPAQQATPFVPPPPIADDDFETPLSEPEEGAFQQWKQKTAPNDSGDDYDLRGAFKAGLLPDAQGHWPDTFKKPNHPTFSVESVYAKNAPHLAGRWNGNQFVPPRITPPPPVADDDDPVLPALPPMPEYNDATYKDRRFISEANVKTTFLEVAERAADFEALANAAKSGQSSITPQAVESAALGLAKAKERLDRAKADYAAVQKDPAPAMASFAGKMAEVGLNTAASVVDVFTPKGVALKGRALSPDDQEQYEKLSAELDEILDFDARTQEGGGSKLPSAREEQIYAQLRALENKPRSETLAGQLAGAAENTFADRNINPNAPNVGAQVARGVGGVVPMLPALLAGPAGVPLAAGQMAGNTYQSTYSAVANQLRAQGIKDERQIEEMASTAAKNSAAWTGPEFAAFMLTGHLAGAGALKLLGRAAPEAGAALRGGTVAAAGTAANVGSSGAIRWAHGEDFWPTVEQLTQDAFFGIYGGAKQYQGARRAEGILAGEGKAMEGLMTAAVDSYPLEYAKAIEARGRATGNAKDILEGMRLRAEALSMQDRAMSAIDEAQAGARSFLGRTPPPREDRPIPTPEEFRAGAGGEETGIPNVDLPANRERVQEGIQERQQQSEEAPGVLPWVEGEIVTAASRPVVITGGKSKGVPISYVEVEPFGGGSPFRSFDFETARIPRVDDMPEGDTAKLSAVIVGDRVFTGKHHAEAEERARKALGEGVRIAPEDSGFITENGNFISREAAVDRPLRQEAREQSNQIALAESRADIDAIAEAAGVKYNGPIEGTGAHQFINPNLGTAGGATFTLRGRVTPERLATKLAEMGKEWGQKTVKDYVEAKDQPASEQRRRAKVAKEVEAPSLEVEKLPTLRKGESQGDILSTQLEPEPFRLIQDEAMDFDARQRATEQAERNRAEQEVRQSDLFTAEEMNQRQRQQSESEALQDVADFNAASGHELIGTIEKLGGLPSITKEAVLTGEVRRLWEANKGRMMRLTRRTQTLGLDRLNESLKEFGFKFETPVQLLEAIEGALSRGEKHIGYEPESQRLRDIDHGRSGGIFTRTGSRGPRPLGSPPSGARNWLEIAPAVKRIGRGLFTEGASIILQERQQNPIGRQLGKATNRQMDVEQELYGRMWKPMHEALRGVSKAARERAYDDVSQHLRDKENGRTPSPLNATGQRLLSAWQDVAEFTGLLAQRSGVQVSTGSGFRPMRLLGRDYVPRMFTDHFLRVIRNPGKRAADWNAYVAELAAHRGSTLADAAAELNELAGGKGRFASNDFMGNIEVARQSKMPESFYEYDLRKLAARYVPRYAARMSQIIAYGQRLEAMGRVIQPNLWDMARGEVRGGDTTSARWLAQAEAQSIGERDLAGIARGAALAQSAATGLMLANPFTTVPRNLISGLYATSELLGAGRSVRTAAIDMVNAGKRMEAKEAGAVQEDMGALLHTDRATGDAMLDRTIRDTSNFLLKISGFNASETVVRTHSFLTASQFARDFVATARRNPNSTKARQMAGLIKRMGVEPQDVLTENGDWKTGENTRTFARKIVETSQGGYKFNQVPLWANTPAGRFFYQFGRWATMRSQNIWRNAILPAFVGTETTIHGVKMRVRDFKPLLRVGLGTVIMGEAFAGLASVLFGRDRRDASFTEIVSAASRGETEKAAAMVGGRILNDIILSGMTGIYATLPDIAKSTKEGSRLKNPFEPPSGAGVRALLNLGLDAMDQGAITGDDMKNFLGQLAPGASGTLDVTRNLIDNPKYEAENDQRTLRNAGLRFAKERGIKVPWRIASDRVEKTEDTPAFAGIRDALIVGDTGTARNLRKEYLSKFRGEAREKAERSLKMSVQNRQPFRVGPYHREDFRLDFMKWAKRNLSKDDVEQITRVQARYTRAAKAVGLWHDEE